MADTIVELKHSYRFEKAPEIGTISEAFDTVQLAYSKGYGIMPCSSRGEGADIADYAVGLGTGSIRESGVGPSANRFLQIEAELGNRAKFLGMAGLKVGPAYAANSQDAVDGLPAS